MYDVMHSIQTVSCRHQLFYFGYNLIVCICFCVMTASVGVLSVLSCFIFTEQIYSSIKADLNSTIVHDLLVIDLLSMSIINLKLAYPDV